MKKALFDFGAIKILISTLAIVAANFVATASTITAPVEYKQTVNSILMNDSKSCPVPYSAEYCSHGNFDPNLCQSDDNLWLSVLKKYSFDSGAGIKRLCPSSGDSKSHNSES